MSAIEDNNYHEIIPFKQHRCGGVKNIAPPLLMNSDLYLNIIGSNVDRIHEERGLGVRSNQRKIMLSLAPVCVGNVYP